VSAFLYLSVFSADEVSAAWDEIETASPRAGTLVAAAFVENHLEHLLRSKMTSDEKLLTEVFGPSHILGSFAAKINIGYLMKLYSKKTWKELDTIKDIRNDFAHKLDVSYETQSVKDRCANLILWKNFEIKITRADNAEDKQALILDLAAGNPDTAYGRFQSACRFYIALMTLMTNEAFSMDI
jgi:hypothetical protein